MTIKEIKNQIHSLLGQVEALEKKEAQKESNPLITTSTHKGRIHYHAVPPEGSNPAGVWDLYHEIDNICRLGGGTSRGQRAGLYVALRVIQQIEKDGGVNLVVDAHKRFYVAALEALRLEVHNH
jgi:hypothetical protein